MDAVRVHTTLTEDGRVAVAGLPFRKGQRVELILLAEPDEPKPGARMTARRLLESPLVGLWEDRDDIQDSAGFARQLRERVEHRGNR